MLNVMQHVWHVAASARVLTEQLLSTNTTSLSSGHETSCIANSCSLLLVYELKLAGAAAADAKTQQSTFGCGLHAASLLD